MGVEKQNCGQNLTLNSLQNNIVCRFCEETLYCAIYAFLKHDLPQ